jgi:hypothetical protein
MLASNGNRCAEPHFDNARLEQAIARLQAGDATSLSEIITLTQPRAETLIRFYKTTSYRSEGELLSDVNFKLLRAVDKFDPAKGTAFTFVSCLIQNSLCTSVSNARKNLVQYQRLSRSMVVTLEAQSEDREAADDIRHQIKEGARTKYFTCIRCRLGKIRLTMSC